MSEPSGFRVWLPALPPSVNHCWRTVVIGGRPSRALTPAGREFRDVVAWCLRSARGPGAPALTGDLELLIRLEDETRRRWDADNRLKAVLDALSHGGAYADDQQISRIVVDRRPQPAEVTRTGIWVRTRSIWTPDFEPEEDGE